MKTQPRERSSVAQTVGLVGDSGDGKTTVATLLADRLRERSTVRLHGEATTFIEDSYRPGRLGIEWTVIDCTPGPAALAARAENLDTAFVVTTPDDLGRVAAYEQIAAEHDLDCFVVINRFTEDTRGQLQDFEGPELAEYFYENESISDAMVDGNPPALEDWSVEAILVEALQPERIDKNTAVASLENGDRQVVNIEVDSSEHGRSLVEEFEDDGYLAAYFQCNCCCHEGHVIARRPEQADNSRATTGKTEQVTLSTEVSR